MEVNSDLGSKKKFNVSGAQLAASLSFVIPFMYLCGYLYQLGRLDKFRISERHFELSFEGYLIQFFLYFVQLFSEILKFTDLSKILAVSGFILMYGFFLYGIHAARDIIREKASMIKRKLVKDRKLTWLAFPVTFTGIVIGAPLFVLFVFSFVILIVLKSYSVGFDRASQEIETFIPCESPNAKCTKVYSGTQILAEGLIIEVSDKAIAIYDGEKTLVLENQNLRIETLPRI
jgi:hypothetical protein